MEARLTEEGVWELPRLEDIIAKGDRIWMQNDFSKKKREQRKQQVTEEYALYQRVLELWRQGVSYHFIGENVEKADNVIRAWIERHQLPNILAGIVYKKRQGKRMNIPDVPNNDLLRVIGLYLATTRYHGVYKQRWTYEKNDPTDPALEYARDVLKAAFGEGSFHEHVKRTVKKPEIFYQIIFQSVSFFEYYNAVTRDSTQVPLKQMPTLEARLAFVEAFCQGSVTVDNEHRRERYETPAPAGLTIIKKTTPESRIILEQATILLNDLGCYPYMGIYPKMSILQITDPDDVTRLLAYGCVPASCRTAAEKIASHITGRRIKGHHVILQAHDATRALPQGLTPKMIAQKQEIATHYGVPMNLVGGWYRGESTPHIVHRRDRLEELRKKYGWEPAPQPPRMHAIDNEVVTFLQATPENEPMRRYIAQRYSLDDVRFYAFALERACVEKSDWSPWLMLPEEILHTRLDRVAPMKGTSNGTRYQLGWQALRDYCQIEKFQPYSSPADEWRSHLRRIRDGLLQQPQQGQITHEYDGLTLALTVEEDRVMVTGIK